MNPSPTLVMLRRVATRVRLASLGRRCYVAWLALCALLALLVLVSRFSGVISVWIGPAALWTLPVGALAAGLLFPRRPTVVDAARAVDHQCGAKDLFLTTVLLDQ